MDAGHDAAPKNTYAVVSMRNLPTTAPPAVCPPLPQSAPKCSATLPAAFCFASPVVTKH